MERIRFKLKGIYILRDLKEACSIKYLLQPEQENLERGGHGGSRYCGIEFLFSIAILVFLILMCGIAVSSSPAVYGFASFWLTVFGKRRSFSVLRYHLFAPSCLKQINTICSTNDSKVNILRL